MSDTSALEQHVITQLHTLAPGVTRVLVAVSGGADSVALLRLLANATHTHPDLHLEVAHVDHSLRDTSAADAQFVQTLSEHLNLTFHTTRVPVARIARERSWNVEDAARRLRYGFLTRVAKTQGLQVIVTAHTQHDQAETVLMQLLRGSAYLRGMRAAQRQIIRPLLGVRKDVLVAYLEVLRQPFREDETNADTSRTRAWLRREVVPLLASRYPAVLQTLAQHANRQQQLEAHFDALARPFVQSEPGNGVDVAALQQHDTAVITHVLATLLKQASVSPDTTKLASIQQALNAPAPQRVSLSNDTFARVAYGKLNLVHTTPAPDSVTPVRDMRDLPAGVSSNALAYPDLVLRFWLPGDRIRLSGGTKKLSDVFIDKKIPREQRARIPVLASGQQVLWIQDVAVSPDVANAPTDTDITFMQQALELAREAAAAGELPVGAVITKAQQVIASARNETEAQRDPSAHAEVLAIRRAATHLGDWRLTDCTLFVTLEPCVMCFGAALQAHVPRVVYGAVNQREGALGGVSALQHQPWKRHIVIRSGVLAKESSALLSEFFKAKRNS